MRKLLHNIGQLSRRQKLVVGVMILIVVATWLATCLVVATILAP